MSRIGTGMLVAALLLTSATALADDSPQEVLDDAKALAGKGETLKAAERYGDAVAAAQAAGDLQIEETIATSLEEFLQGVQIDAIRRGAKSSESGATSDAPSQASLLAAVMRKLDSGRCGAYVAAPVLARNLLLLATESGDFASAADATSVAAAHAKKAGSGRAAAVVAKYAEAMRAETDGKFDVAAPLLDAASLDAAKAGWLDLVSHAGTEAAFAWMKTGNAEKAAASMTAAAAAVGAKPDLNRINAWSSFAKKRLAETPETVMKPLADLAEKAKGPNSVSASGGKGGAGEAAGGPTPVSDIGKILPKLAKGKPLVTVKCAPKGLEIHWVTGADEKPVRPFEEMVRIADLGGVTLALQNRSVALMMVDLRGNRGQPGESSHASLVRAFYLLADGETWGVSKDGIVTIAR